jgi:hypothetical protein
LLFIVRFILRNYSVDIDSLNGLRREFVHAGIDLIVLFVKDHKLFFNDRSIVRSEQTILRLTSTIGSHGLHVSFELVWVLKVVCIAGAVGYVRASRSPQDIVARTCLGTFWIDTPVEGPRVVLIFLWFFDLETVLGIRNYILSLSEIFFASILQQDTIL